MKKFALSALYVCSIAVAIVIGLCSSSVFEDSTFEGSRASECKQSSTTNDCDDFVCGSWSQCTTVEARKGADSCAEKPNVACYESGTPLCSALTGRKSDATLTYTECNKE